MSTLKIKKGAKAPFYNIKFTKLNPQFNIGFIINVIAAVMITIAITPPHQPTKRCIAKSFSSFK